MLVAFLLLAILTVSAVSADENATADIAEIDDAVEIDNEINDDVLSADDTDVLSADENDTFSFGTLARQFMWYPESEIYLNHDYQYIGPEYYVEMGVNRTLVDKYGIGYNVTIHGNGHKFEAYNLARIFNIHSSNVVLKDIVFVNGKFDGDGGSILWQGKGGTLDNCTFINSNAETGGAVYVSGDGMTITNCKFEDTSAKGSAGAIYWEGDNGKVSGCKFINCSSGRGGGAAIKWMGADGIVTDCTFDKCRGRNYSIGGSGPIGWCGVRGKVSNCNFKDSNSDNAGAIHWEGVNGTVNNCNFENCSEQGHGTIYWFGENGIVTDCNFTNCYEYGGDSHAIGSAIYWEGANGTVNNSNFINCSVKYMNGGAIAWQGANGTVNNSNFINCSAVRGGGAVVWSGKNGGLFKSNFIGCSASGNGGAVVWNGDNGSIYDSDFISCSAYHGGAVYWHTVFDNINSNCSFFNCSASGNGGAVHWEFSVGSVYDCNFTNCSAKNYGGALYDQHNLVHGSAFGDGVSVYRSIFVNNQATSNGGAYLAAAGDVVNCSFINTTSGRYGAIVGVGNVINSIFVNCSAISSGGAIESPKDVINCSFYNCSSMEHGGAIKSASNVINSSFNNCSAKSNGGAIFDAKDVINSSFNDCYATESGAIQNPSRVINCTFDNCVSLNLAGALTCYNRIVVNNSNFTNCLSVNGSAGAIFWSGQLGVLSYSNFINCSSKERGGAIDWDGRDGIMRDSNFINCSADYGGAISRGSAMDCTFYGNKANTEGDNWYLTSVPKLYLTIPNFSSTYGFNEALFFNATNADGIAVTDVIITVRVYKNDTLVGTYDVLTNQNWAVGLDAGNYTAQMAIEHHAYVFNKAVTVTLKIAKMPTNITASPVLTVYNADGYLVATIKDVKGNPVADIPMSVDLNGIQNVTSDENGQISISTIGLPSDVYSAVIVFNGSSNYENSSAVVNVTVEKASPVISASAVTTVYNGGKYLVVTLKDANGNPIVGAKVSININGAKSVTTDANGQAKLTTNSLAPKSYTAKIAFAGDNNYNASSTTAKVTVKKATPKLTAKAKTFKKSVKTKKYAVTLKTNQNKVMKNTKVTIKVNKKTYTAKTNSKGVATFKITKLTKKGKYTATVKYAGSKYYNVKSVNVKITVK